MIAITGPQGQLGLALIERLEKESRSFEIFLGDICDLRSFNLFLESYPKITTVINCAAFTNVDQAENNPLNWEVNAWGPYQLAQVCHRKDIRLIHISTDYVFGLDLDGSMLNGTWTKKIPPIAMNDYGRAKTLGELAVMSVYHKNAVIRVSGLVSAEKGLIRKFYDMARERKTASIVKGTVYSPTSVYLMADAILYIHDMEKSGVFHYAPTNAVPLIDLWKYIARTERVEIVESEKRKARRHKASCLATSSVFTEAKLNTVCWNHVDDVLHRIRNKYGAKLHP